MTAAFDPPFLMDYVGYDQLTQIVKDWAQSYPEFVRLSSLGRTERDRDIWLIELGRQPDRLRPAICIDANMHSAELLGTNVALCIAQDLIDLHRDQSDSGNQLSSSAKAIARDGLYYIIPRVSPDGAEEVLSIGRVSRSAPRRRGHATASNWIRCDADGNNKIRQIRMQHPAGEFVEHPDHRHVLVPRSIDDGGPFFKVYPEGMIEGFNGVNVPFAHTLSDNDADFNRNFPFDWSSEHDGAGGFPGWDPETQALISFAERSPHIFAWLNLHTFGGVLIRPPFSNSSTEVDREDLLVYDYAAVLAERYTGMRTVSAFDDMTSSPAHPMTGTLAAWAYGERGCMAWAIELWDLFAAAGLQKRRPFFRNYAVQEREEIAMLAQWDARENGGRVFAPWRTFQHPQLKEVEIGGIDPVRGLINPPEHQIAPISRRMSLFAVALASLAPRLQSRVTVASISPKLSRIDLYAANAGYLPTYVAASSRRQPWNRGLLTRARAIECELVSGLASSELGHLRGWGRGNHEEANAPFFQKSQGIDDIAISWVVEGRGRVEIEIGSPRVGWNIHEVVIGT